MLEFRLILLAFVLGSMPFCEAFQLTIMHTNDVHAHFEQANARGGRCRNESLVAGKCFGGIARRYSMIQELKRTNQNTLLLDAGDQYQGTRWFYVYKGLATAHFMNMLGYQAMCLGNHEFDNYVAGVLPLLDNANFPILAANMDDSQEPSIQGKVKKYTIIEVGGEKIGIVGYILKDVPLLSKTGKLIFHDEIESLQPIVDTLLGQGVNMIIALGHAGYARDIAIAKAVRGLDVVVGGHSNAFLYSGDPPTKDKVKGEYPTMVTQDDGRKVLVVQDYWFGKYLGLLNVNFTAEGEIGSWTGNPILMDNTVPEDPEILADLHKWHKLIANMSGEIVGSTKVYLDGNQDTCRLRECNMGNLIADAMVWNGVTRSANPQTDSWSNVAVGIANSGGIRAAVDKGYISFEDIQEVHPFGNIINMVDIDGANLMQILEHGVSHYDEQWPDGSFLQLSGVHVTYDLSRTPGNRVVAVRVRCADCLVPRYEPVNHTKIYTVITNEFTINGGDGFTFNVKRKWNIGALDIDITTSYIDKFSPMICDEEERIQFSEPDTEYDFVTTTASPDSAVARSTLVHKLCITIVLFLFCFVLFFVF